MRSIRDRTEFLHFKELIVSLTFSATKGPDFFSSDFNTAMFPWLGSSVNGFPSQTEVHVPAISLLKAQSFLTGTSGVSGYWDRCIDNYAVNPPILQEDLI